MNFSQSTFSAILASVIAAGIIALAAYLWKNRNALRNAFKKKETIRKETVEIERFIRSVKRWRSVNTTGLTLSITQSGKIKKNFTIKFQQITEIRFVRKATPELSMLMLKFSESSRTKSRTVFVEEHEFNRVCKILYFIEVSK